MSFVVYLLCCMPITFSQPPDDLLPPMILVQGGTFVMGDTWGEGSPSELPLRQVTLTYDFYMSKYQATFHDYDRFCDETGRSLPADRDWGRGDRPVIGVSWWDAIAYCNWLSDKDGVPRAYDSYGNFIDGQGNVTTDPARVIGYRLPTEAEWEFAARGGNNSEGYAYPGSEHFAEVAWYCGNSGDEFIDATMHYAREGIWERLPDTDPPVYAIYVLAGWSQMLTDNRNRTHEVGSRKPNELGLYDMAGNVWEWCSDYYSSYGSDPEINPFASEGSSRVLRGGSHRSYDIYLRVSKRSAESPAGRYTDTGFRIARTASSAPSMVLVEGGTFLMGDEFGDLWWGCRPQHQVTLSYDFFIAKYPITFSEYDRFSDDTLRRRVSDQDWGRDDRPAINVSWWDAIAYCNWLSEREGLPVAYRLSGEVDEGQLLDAHGRVTSDVTVVVGYRLPTEAEWEYAARGGSSSQGFKYPGSNAVSSVAWYAANSSSMTHPVGRKEPNELGIFDMAGNIWEWCSDFYVDYTEGPKMNPYISDGELRMMRGGSWRSNASFVRTANRFGLITPTPPGRRVGFRVVITAP